MLGGGGAVQVVSHSVRLERFPSALILQMCVAAPQVYLTGAGAGAGPDGQAHSTRPQLGQGFPSGQNSCGLAVGSQKTGGGGEGESPIAARNTTAKGRIVTAADILLMRRVEEKERRVTS